MTRDALRVAYVFLAMNVLLGCPEPPERESAPVYPGEEAAIRGRVLSPTGNLVAITASQAQNALTDSLSAGTSPAVLPDTILEVIESSEVQTKSATNDADAYESPQVERIQQPLMADGSVDGWIELRVLCGDEPLNHMEADGVIDLIYRLDGDLAGGVVPLGVAWGEARNCALWNQDTPTIVDGDFSLIFANGDLPTFFEFLGTQETDVVQRLDVAGFYSGAEVGWTIEVGDQPFVVGSDGNALFVHDCSGRWQCGLSPLSCTFLTAGSALVEPTCARPSVESLSW